VPELSLRRVRVHVSGDVQGVGFRWSCRNEAAARGVSGFVRNLADGTVEAAFEGPADAVDRLVAWCRKGPTWGRVVSVDVLEEPPTREQGFRIEA
jgi:acylphosphatase